MGKTYFSNLDIPPRFHEPDLRVHQLDPLPKVDLMDTIPFMPSPPAGLTLIGRASDIDHAGREFSVLITQLSRAARSEGLLSVRCKLSSEAMLRLLEHVHKESTTNFVVLVMGAIVSWPQHVARMANQSDAVVIAVSDIHCLGRAPPIGVAMQSEATNMLATSSVGTYLYTIRYSLHL